MQSKLWKKAGAVTSLAHFHKKIGFKNYTREEQEANIKYLHEIGLDGMEAYYPNYSEDDENLLIIWLKNMI